MHYKQTYLHSGITTGWKAADEIVSVLCILRNNKVRILNAKQYKGKNVKKSDKRICGLRSVQLIRISPRADDVRAAYLLLGMEFSFERLAVQFLYHLLRHPVAPMV